MLNVIIVKSLRFLSAFLCCWSLSQNAFADHAQGDSARAGDNFAAYLHMDGQILTLRNEGSGGYLRQGYGARRDDKRNVEADRGLITAPRGKGFDWVLRPAGDGYWYIVNLKTVLFLTLSGDSGKSRNVVNWGWHIGEDDDFKWKIVPGPIRSRMPGFTEQFHIVNKATGSYLRTFGGNVTSMPHEGKSFGHESFQWRARGSELTDFERDIRAKTSTTRLSLPSDDLSSLLKLTITSVKAIKTSTGQDGATKVLFSGIDLAVDIGMGVASGGASAAGKAGAKAGLKAISKKASRAVTREAVQAAAEAALRQQGERIVKKAIRKGVQEATNRALGDPKTKVKNRAKQAMGFEGAAAAAANVSNDVLNALSSEAIFNKVYGDSDDDLEIGVNGSSIFPNGGRSKGRKISSQETLSVNKVAIFEADRGLDIHLIEYDYGSDDDSLGWSEWRMPDEPGWLDHFIKTNGVLEYNGVLISSKSEGSLYELNYRIEPFRPYFLTRGKLGRASLEREYANLGCVSDDPAICARYVKELMGFDNWVNRPHIRDQVLATYQTHCEHKGGARKIECRETDDPLRATCNAGLKESCERKDAINKAASLFVNLRIWEGNCRQSQDREENCIKLATAFLEGAPYEGPPSIQFRWQSTAQYLYEFCESGSESSCRMSRAFSQKLCAYFDDAGCFYRGRLDEMGMAGPLDTDAASKWYKTGCQFNGGTSCAAIAQMKQDTAKQVSLSLSNRQTVPLYALALAEAARGCGYGSEFSCSIASDIEAEITAEKEKNYYKCEIANDHAFCAAAGREFEESQQYGRARNAYQSGCVRAYNETADGAACYAYAKIFLNHSAELAPQTDPNTDPKTDPVDVLKESLPFFKMGCEVNHLESCIETSRILTSDTFADRDPDQAYALIQKICENALLNGGEGAGTACDERNRVYDLLPVTIHDKGCKSGDAAACVALGNHRMKPYATGPFLQIPAEVTWARHDYFEACALNNATGCKLLGDLDVRLALRDVDVQAVLQLGENVLDARGEFVYGAQTAYDKACKLQNAEACSSLEGMLANPIFGLGVGGNGNSPGQTQNTQASGNPSTGNPAPHNEAPNSNGGAARLIIQSGDGCARRGTLVSDTSGVGANVTLNNVGKHQLFVYWLDESGKDTDYDRSGKPLAVLQPGETQKIRSATGLAYSIFSVDNGQTECVGVAEVTAIETTILMSRYVVPTNNVANENVQQPPIGDVANSTALDDQDNLELFAGAGCELRGSVTSYRSGQQAAVSFANTGTDPLYVYWLDENGSDNNYDYTGSALALVEAGQTQEFVGEVGFAYSVFSSVDDQLQCFGVAQIKSANTFISMANGRGSVDDDSANTANDPVYQDSISVPTEVVLESGYGCEMRGNVASGNSGAGARVSFANHGSDALFVYWIDEGGSDTDYSHSGSPLARIAAGETRELDGRVGFYYSVFSVRDGQTQCVGMTEITSRSVRVLMSGDSLADHSGYGNDNQTGDQDIEVYDQGNQAGQAGPGCELRGQLASYNSGEAATASFYNAGSDILYVYWLDENGQESNYSGSGGPLLAVDAGDTQTVDAYIGFAYAMFSTSNGETVCVGLTEVTQSDSVFDVSNLY